MATIPAPDDDVEKVLTRIMSQNSGMMKQARTQGLQGAQAAGLGQSTKGIQAAQAAAYNAALPIASQQAQQAHQKGMQTEQFGHERGMQEAGFGQQTKMQTAQFGHETGMQSAGFQHAASQAELDRRTQSELQLQGAYLDRVKMLEELNRTLPFQAQESALQRQMQERIASMEVSAANKERALSAMTQFNNTYQAAYSQIAANENLPADARNQMLGHLQNVMNHNQNLTTSLYRYEVPW